MVEKSLLLLFLSDFLRISNRFFLHLPLKMNVEEFIRKNRTADVRELMLHASRYADVDVRQAVVQIAAWQRARTKLPLWAATDGIVFPEQLPMEQCSSEATGRYKRELLLPDVHGGMDGEVCRMTDLTGGFGVDATMICREADHVKLTFVERNPALCGLARHNLPLLGVRQAEVVCGEAEQVLPTLPRQYLIYIDPARRDQHGGKTVAIADCTPDVAQLNDLLLEKAERVAIKLSPMLDITLALQQLHGVEAVHVVSVEGECKELLLLMRDGFEGEVQLCCVNLKNDGAVAERFAFSYQEESASPCPLAQAPAAYLYEPNASLMKAGAFRCVAHRFGLEKLHPSSHLYTSDRLVPDFPGRKFAVKAWANFNKKELKSLLAGLKQANISVRNSPLSVAELRKRLKLNDGGTDYLFATTLTDERHVLIRCEKTR